MGVKTCISGFYDITVYILLIFAPESDFAQLADMPSARDSSNVVQPVALPAISIVQEAVRKNQVLETGPLKPLYHALHRMALKNARHYNEAEAELKLPEINPEERKPITSQRADQLRERPGFQAKFAKWPFLIITNNQTPDRGPVT